MSDKSSNKGDDKLTTPSFTTTDAISVLPSERNFRASMPRRKAKPRRVEGGQSPDGTSDVASATSSMDKIASTPKPKPVKKKVDPNSIDFPLLLLIFVNDVSESHPDMVEWRGRGSAIHIDSSHPEVNVVVGRHFPGMDIEALKEELHCFGFQKHRSVDTYVHPNFRQKRTDVGKVKRRFQSPTKKDADALVEVAAGSACVTGRETSGKDAAVEPAQNQSSSKKPKKYKAQPGAAHAKHQPEKTDEEEKKPSARKELFVAPESTSPKEKLKDDGDSYPVAHPSVGSAANTSSTPSDDLDDPMDIGDDDEHFDASENTATNDEKVEEKPLPKFKILQNVYASDQDGLMYEAVIRRALFGPSYMKQVNVGFVRSDEEAEEALRQADDEACWHYFVHYKKWNSTWDRWVPENKILLATDEAKQYTAKLAKAHRDLRNSMTKKMKGKKNFQTVNGADFLRAWKDRMQVIAGDSSMPVPYMQAQPPPAPAVETIAEKTTPAKRAKLETWTKEKLASEKNLREKGLSVKRPQVHASKIVLPFSVKKLLVEQWEVISQCDMVYDLPAKVTIRDAFNQYLKAKGISRFVKEIEEKSKCGDGAQLNKPVANTSMSSLNDLQGQKTSDSVPNAPVAPDPVEKKEVGKATKNKPTETVEPTEVIEDVTTTPGDSALSPNMMQEEEWINMANGICMFFDEALASRLLYREELPQARSLRNIPELADKPNSEIYGCGHLLRLFIRLPEILADELTEAQARPILAKVNDFVRFLHKNQTEILSPSYRKPNEIEIAEKRKLQRIEERKRKASTAPENLEREKKISRID